MHMIQGSSSSSSSSMYSTLSKDDNFVFFSEDSSCPDHSNLHLGLALTLSPSPIPLYARILTSKDFPSSSASSSSSSSSLNRKSNVTSGNKRVADSVVSTNGSGQVVGWPPLRTYRMNSLNHNSKLPDAEVIKYMVDKSKSNIAVESSSDKSITAKQKENLRSSLFVKVNKDGTPIGRKIDLSAYSSYETLARTLEDMFNEPTTVTTCKGSNGEGHGITAGMDGQSKLLDGSSNFVLTYEDGEGDWMLVGDVPWWMFLSSVRRLRIMRTYKTNGLAPRFEEKSRRLKNKPI
ncbi:hypothetical protein Lal_00023463 [Lupinus albus]|uniref:Auxin-induced protein n=1 Tax=Lupinus albus TaxID=3870 RepID=A0A6A5N5X3_LUPAL|nr:putative transcription factor interactor and regulator AUX-IAA family [Lupinus albus]KAF1881427.1 hypothetical protein Lal_00023463 [Lupinus albus]